MEKYLSTHKLVLKNIMSHKVKTILFICFVLLAQTYLTNEILNIDVKNGDNLAVAPSLYSMVSFILSLVVVFYSLIITLNHINVGLIKGIVATIKSGMYALVFILVTVSVLGVALESSINSSSKEIAAGLVVGLFLIASPLAYWIFLHHSFFLAKNPRKEFEGGWLSYQLSLWRDLWVEMKTPIRYTLMLHLVVWLFVGSILERYVAGSVPLIVVTKTIVSIGFAQILMHYWGLSVNDSSERHD